MYNYYETVFDKLPLYKNRIKSHYTEKAITEKEFKDFRSYQMSDHLPLWVEMKTDLADSYLKFVKDQSK